MRLGWFVLGVVLKKWVRKEEIQFVYCFAGKEKKRRLVRRFARANQNAVFLRFHRNANQSQWRSFGCLRGTISWSSVDTKQPGKLHQTQQIQFFANFTVFKGPGFLVNVFLP
jgi:hypothetical protein